MAQAAGYMARIPLIAGQIRATHNFTFAPKSQLARESAELGDNAAAFVTDGFTAAVARIVAAEDHLSAIAHLVQDEYRVFPQYTVARGCSEIAALAWWFLDPDISGMRRAHRGFEDRKASLLAQRGLRIPDAAQHAQRRLYELDKSGNQAKLGKVGSADRWPSPTDALRDVWGSASDPLFGDVVYGLLSAFGHGTLYALTSMAGAEVEGTREGRVSLRVLETNPKQQALMMLLASMPYASATTRLLETAGWAGEDLSAHLAYMNRDLLNLQNA
ncbi:MAG: hypothetical protein H0W51_10120 [Euzebyales bacterium]|nr:hypothetical protein [Euzebyales bacterium]